MEDGIISPAGARQVVEWALAHLECGELDRRLTGRALAGLGRALRRCEKPSYVEEVLLTAERHASVQQPRNPRRPRPLMPGSSPASRV
jgi:hypothetical protein